MKLTPAAGSARVPAATIDHMDVSESDFQSAVIDRSHTVPVVVDFFAPGLELREAGLDHRAEADDAGVGHQPPLTALARARAR